MDCDALRRVALSGEGGGGVVGEEEARRLPAGGDDEAGVSDEGAVFAFAEGGGIKGGG